MILETPKKEVALHVSHALRRLQADTALGKFWKQAEQKFGTRSRTAIELRLINIYDGISHRPKILRKARDRVLNKVMTSLNRLEDACDHPMTGGVVDKLLTPVAMSVFQLKPSGFNRRKTKIFSFLSLQRMAKKLRRKIENRIFSKEVLTSSEFETKSSKDFVRRMKIILNHLRKIEKFTDSSQEVRPILETAFNRLVAPAFMPNGKSGFSSFKEMLAKLQTEIRLLKREKKFYTRRNISTTSAKKTYLVERYSDLVCEVYGTNKNSVTAAMLSAVEPEYFLDATYSDVAAVLKRRKK